MPNKTHGWPVPISDGLVQKSETCGPWAACDLSIAAKHAHICPRTHTVISVETDLIWNKGSIFQNRHTDFSHTEDRYQYFSWILMRNLLQKWPTYKIWEKNLSRCTVMQLIVVICTYLKRMKQAFSAAITNFVNAQKMCGMHSQENEDITLGSSPTRRENGLGAHIFVIMDSISGMLQNLCYKVVDSVCNVHLGDK